MLEIKNFRASADEIEGMAEASNVKLNIVKEIGYDQIANIKGNEKEIRQFLNFYFEDEEIEVIIDRIKNGKSSLTSEASYNKLRNEVEKMKQLKESKPIETDNMSEQQKMEYVKKDVANIEHIENPSEELQLMAAEVNGYVVKYIENPSEEVQLEAVRNIGAAIDCIKNPSEKVKLEAVKSNGTALQYIKNPSEAVQMAAVKSDGHAIQYIKNPSEELQLAAVNQNGLALVNIKNPSQELQLEAVKNKGTALQYIENPSQEMILAAVNNEGNAIEYIENPSQELILTAIQNRGESIKYINNASEELQLLAVSKNGEAIRFIENPSEEVQLAAVNHIGSALDYIKNPTEKAQLAAVKKFKYALKYIKDPSEEVQLEAVKNYGPAIRYLLNPSEEVQLMALKNGAQEDDYKFIENKYKKVTDYFRKLNENKQNDKKANYVISLNKSAAERSNKDNELIKFSGTEEELMKFMLDNYVDAIEDYDAEVDDDSYATPLKDFEKWKKEYNNNVDPSGSAVVFWIMKNGKEVFKSEFKEKDFGTPTSSKKKKLSAMSEEEIQEMSDEELIKIVTKKPWDLEYIKNPSEAVQLAAVNKEGYTIDCIENPSEKVQLAAINHTADALDNIKNPTEKVQLAAIRKYGSAIKYIENPTEEMQLEALKQSASALRYVKNPTEEMQLEAVKRDGSAIEYIKNPTEEMKMEAVKRDGYALEYIKNPTEEMKMEAVKESGNAIEYIKNPSEEIQIAAVKEDGLAIQYIKNPSEEIQMAAVQERALAIKFIKNPSKEVQIEAVKQRGEVIEYIKNPSEAVQIAAVKQDGKAIEYIKNPSKEVQIAAVKQAPSIIEYIENPSEAVQIAAVKEEAYALTYIENPSEAVQIAALDTDPSIFKYIENPTEAIEKYFKNLKEAKIMKKEKNNAPLSIATLHSDFGNMLLQDFKDWWKNNQEDTFIPVTQEHINNYLKYLWQYDNGVLLGTDDEDKKETEVMIKNYLSPIFVKDYKKENKNLQENNEQKVTSFEELSKKYMPTQGEGEALASQIITAMNKIEYKWYNDGDVYDNTKYLEGWANDLSSYANWLYKNVPQLEQLLLQIFEIKTGAEYEDLIEDLKQEIIKLNWEELENKEKQGNIYSEKGPFKFEEIDEDDEDEDLWESKKVKKEESNSNNDIDTIINNFKVNAPLHRGQEKPKAIDIAINEINFDDQLRYKNYDIEKVDEETIDLRWIAQGTLDRADELENEIERAFKALNKNLGINFYYVLVYTITSRMSNERVVGEIEFNKTNKVEESKNEVLDEVFKIQNQIYELLRYGYKNGESKQDNIKATYEAIISDYPHIYKIHLKDQINKISDQIYTNKIEENENSEETIIFRDIKDKYSSEELSPEQLIEVYEIYHPNIQFKIVDTSDRNFFNIELKGSDNNIKQFLEYYYINFNGATDEIIDLLKKANNDNIIKKYNINF